MYTEGSTRLTYKVHSKKNSSKLSGGAKMKTFYLFGGEFFNLLLKRMVGVNVYKK